MNFSVMQNFLLAFDRSYIDELINLMFQTCVHIFVLLSTKIFGSM